MSQQYFPGQRWISDSEAELGLGTVLTCDQRLLTLLYPASGETRQYSLRNAPLTRVRFVPGDEISHHDGWSMTVREVEEHDGLLTYHGFDRNNEDCSLPETGLSNFIRFRLASDRLLAGQVDPLDWFSLRYSSLQQRSKQQQSGLWGLGGPRIAPIAHQLHIGREVADRMAPRVLLADEVGLGKTIEAGLVIHRQLLTGRASRILLIVPESLVHQWLVELLRRFNLQASIYDYEVFRASDADNPFEDAQIALMSLDWIRDDEQARNALLAAQWDILVVDEAHHLEWSPEQASPSYALVERLAQQISGVLLLTATPEQLGLESHFARLRLLDPHRFHDLAAFREESRHFHTIADAAGELLEDHNLSAEHSQLLEQLLDGQQDLIRQARQPEAREAREQLVHMLVDRHGTGRLLFRNTRAAMQGFPGRLLHPAPLLPPAEYLPGGSGLKSRLYPELYYQSRLPEDSEQRWWQFDPRVDWLLETLKSLKGKKVLVICASAYTALDLDEALRVRSGIPATTFHEGMTIIERDRAAAWFSDEEFGAQVLICSEIGSEGRNFQFSHHLVLFDLPLHPDLLEQRIGRLDRIGQEHDINIHVPYFSGGSQQRMFEWYHQGHDAFLNTSPTAQALEQQFAGQLETALPAEGDEPAWQELLEQARTLRLQLAEEMHRGRDRLLEINSGGSGRGEQLAAQIIRQEKSFDLPIYMEQLFDAFGIHSEDHSDNAFILRPGEKMLDASFPLGSDEAVTITYDRDLALSREDMQFITWEHPMVQGGMDLVLSGSMGNSAVALLKNKAVKPGTVLVELLYVSEAIAPRHLQLGRYMPPTIIRCLLDQQGRNLADKVSFETLNSQLESVPRASAAKFARSQRDDLASLVKKADALVQPRHQELAQQAHAAFEQALNAEIGRLVALQQINPSVRDEEINLLRRQLEEGSELLGKATVRLEAIRVLVAG
ncbi:RNA polymerase-associated protein RapA [Thiopseudomonas denitrificans]|uniref:RNA polymerase-associated protein RapA n=1 Tax=Thiopseudomonas denitrificans TaxID=1501432 RepID=A0A4R6U1I0_9GAMM|nr:RNA polymerase-associated protein RapA [Thiopseudomonas denitrificans]TDQ40258.1 ATP-dependent helicase HepA [Thiopseudomonas denitrificans]